MNEIRRYISDSEEYNVYIYLYDIEQDELYKDGELEAFLEVEISTQDKTFGVVNGGVKLKVYSIKGNGVIYDIGIRMCQRQCYGRYEFFFTHKFLECRVFFANISMFIAEKRMKMKKKWVLSIKRWIKIFIFQR